MNDFFRDPSYPDRPQHPDFWRMVSVVNKLDGEAVEGGLKTAEILADIVDTDSLTYMATQRTLRLRGHLQRTDPRLRAAMENPVTAAAMAALWLDAFAAGVLFQNEGGHQDAPSG